MREFAEAEIVVPDGPFEGRRYRCDRQPYSRLWFDAIDSGRWSRYVATGPTQSGKTLTCFIVPTLYHLFEVGETVICGVPTSEVAADKWREDLLPAIESSRYRNLLPSSGGGSRGGKVDSIKFRNGATLKFMSGGGNDKKRAAFTSRVVVITETDGMDESGGNSREADKITQIEARTRAYGSRKRVYMECTVSVKAGRTWREYEGGTASQIMTCCPHCGTFDCLERDAFVGWQDAENKIEAGNLAAWHCPTCGEEWTEADRRVANERAVLLHRGEEIAPSGEIVGEPVPTDTLGFRWTATNNLFVTAADVGRDEWAAARSENEENAEKEMRQFVWTIPYEPPQWDTTPLEVRSIIERVGPEARGLVPDGTTTITAGIDIGKWQIHWLAVAWRDGANGAVIDYGLEEVPSRELGPELAIMHTLRNLRDSLMGGWPDGEVYRKPNLVLIDSKYQTDVIFAFCAESGMPFMPSQGRGSSADRVYHRPKSTGNHVQHIGEEYHIALHTEHRLSYVEANADHWKTWLHERLSADSDNGRLVLYNAPPSEHLTLAKHLTAERATQEFVAGKGLVYRWIKERKANHWLDCAYNACVAAHVAGVRLIAEPAAHVTAAPVVSGGLTRPDGRPWVAR